MAQRPDRVVGPQRAHRIHCACFESHEFDKVVGPEDPSPDPVVKVPAALTMAPAAPLPDALAVEHEAQRHLVERLNIEWPPGEPFYALVEAEITRLRAAVTDLGVVHLAAESRLRDANEALTTERHWKNQANQRAAEAQRRMESLEADLREARR